MIGILSRRNYDAYGNFSPGEYYYNKHGIVPHQYNAESISAEFQKIFIDKFNTSIIHSCSTTTKEGIVCHNALYSIKRKSIAVGLRVNGDGFDVVVLHDNSEFAQTLCELIDSFYTKRHWTENRMSILIQKETGITTQDFVIKVGDIDVAMNYGEEFVSVYDKIIKRLNATNDKGLILFHGLPGTGKTSLIKYIAKHIKKEVLFIPSNLGESLCSPSFIPFLLSHSNSILIIEDAEKIISDRESRNSSFGVSNILNISDGILGDCLNIQIIATFNTKRDKIDAALLRKGRLIAEHEFGKLSAEQSNKLIAHLGINKTVSEPMTIGDIYNLEETEFTVNKVKKLGFEITAIKNNVIPEARVV